ncbi:MAG: hypothetical protein QG640_145 [Patescibacteria group bacterium]|nr:hypothetical protein [Patescibacteria group bacterium]
MAKEYKGWRGPRKSQVMSSEQIASFLASSPRPKPHCTRIPNPVISVQVHQIPIRTLPTPLNEAVTIVSATDRGLLFEKDQAGQEDFILLCAAANLQKQGKHLDRRFTTSQP